jgi:hypothetical protein
MPSEPKVSVRLETDDHGSPEIVQENTRRHYKVIMEIEDAPADTYAATFELDSSYYDPVRMVSPDATGKFKLETTTYGDYPLLVRLHRPKDGDVVLKEGMARALRRARDKMPANPQVDEAVAYIANH